MRSGWSEKDLRSKRRWKEVLGGVGRGLRTQYKDRDVTGT